MHVFRDGPRHYIGTGPGPAVPIPGPCLKFGVLEGGCLICSFSQRLPFLDLEDLISAGCMGLSCAALALALALVLVPDETWRSR
jgi:hypothetical protein